MQSYPAKIPIIIGLVVEPLPPCPSPNSAAEPLQIQVIPQAQDPLYEVKLFG